MAFGPAPVKDANAGAPVLGIKLSKKQELAGHGIPGQTYLWYEVEIVGLHPGLLMANLNTIDLPLPGDVRPRGGMAMITARGKKAKPAAAEAIDADEPPTDARNRKIIQAGQKSGYFSPDDTTALVCPAANLRSMFVDAAKCFPGSGFARACGSGVLIEPDFVPFVDPETNKQLKYGRGTRVVEHPVSSRMPAQSDVLVLLYKAKSSTGKRIATARPYLPAWKLRFRVGLDSFVWTDDSSGEQEARERFQNNILVYAGGYVGLMAWRPGAPKGPGPFGRYQVARFDKAK